MHTPFPSRRWFDFCLWGVPMALCLALPGLGALFAAVAVIAVLFFRPEARFATLALWWRGPLASLALGVGIGLLTSIATTVLIEPMLERLLGSTPDVHALGAIKGNLSAYLQLLAIGLFFGGIAEETIFRSYTIGWGVRLFGNRAAIPLLLFSSAVFGFSHLYQGTAGVVETGCIGLILGTTYLATGRKLAASMFAHMTIDAIGITELYRGVSFVDFLQSHAAHIRF